MTESTVSTNETNTLYLTVLSYAALYIVWGSTYLFIKLAVETIPPYYVVGFRFFAGGLFFLVLSLITGRMKRLPTIKETVASFVLGTFLLIGGNGLVTMAERSVDSYLAALILSCTPVMVALFDRILVGKKLSKIAWTGIITGVFGVAVLLYEGKGIFRSVTPDVLLTVGGLVSWSFATSLGHRFTVFPDILVNSSMQMLFVGVVCCSVSYMMQPLTATMVSGFSLLSLISVAYLAIIGSMTFCAYTYLIRTEPAIRIVSYAFVNPLIAIFLGIVIAHETPKPLLWPGTILILAGLFAMLYGDMVLKTIKPKFRR